MSAPTIASPRPEAAAISGLNGRIPTLDGWRGIAILLVLVEHARKALQFELVPTGVHGVTLFFVLSGFLITSRMMSEQERTGSVNLKSFYVRRFFRLMPCAWLYLIVVILISRGSTVQTDVSEGVIPSLLFFRNYVHPAGILLTGHFWSLSIEEQFYLVWPATFLLAGRRRSAWIALVASAAVAGFRLLHWNDSAILSFSCTQFRADALLIGCATAILLPHARPLLRSWMALPLLAALGLCVASYHDLVPLRESVMIAALLAVTASTSSIFFEPLNWKPMAFLGIVSYSLYIWQEPFMFFPYRTADSRLIGLASLILIAATSHFLVEKRMIRLGARMRSQTPYATSIAATQ